MQYPHESSLNLSKNSLLIYLVVEFKAALEVIFLGRDLIKARVLDQSCFEEDFLVVCFPLPSPVNNANCKKLVRDDVH